MYIIAPNHGKVKSSDQGYSSKAIRYSGNDSRYSDVYVFVVEGVAYG